MFEGEMGLIVFGDGVGSAVAAAAAGVDESGTAVVVEVVVVEMDAVEVVAPGSIWAVEMSVRLTAYLSCLDLAHRALGEEVVVDRPGR